jgi:hypothetical protein
LHSNHVRFLPIASIPGLIEIIDRGVPMQRKPPVGELYDEVLGLLEKGLGCTVA